MFSFEIVTCYGNTLVPAFLTLLESCPEVTFRNEIDYLRFARDFNDRLNTVTFEPHSNLQEEMEVIRC